MAGYWNAVDKTQGAIIVVILVISPEENCETEILIGLSVPGNKLPCLWHN